MLTQLNEGAKNHEVCKFSMFHVVPRKREGKADSANAWHALRPIILVLTAYTASQHAAGAKQFLPCTYLYSVHCRTNSQFSDLVTFILFSISSLRGAQFGNVWSRLNKACYAIRSNKPFIFLDILRSVYFSYAHSIISY
jgi:hypothetical protein